MVRRPRCQHADRVLVHWHARSRAPRGKKHSISNRLTVSNGFDKQLSPAETESPSCLALYPPCHQYLA
jgi:hypothetical protein